ncbi:hypothetical protein [Thermococcus sp. M36]|uniref:hypothetical protein n=1 Tax=Thermococcus sp. M36 TaxID=1638261 RepID=UPI00143BADC0|nr:hypothetical protein [Thermococcus sp. M36]
MAIVTFLSSHDPLLFTHFIERQKALKQYYGKYYDREIGSKIDQYVAKKRGPRKRP